jgi:cellulose synthase/poly-beta-1,6-N-acetylglucosamine synthase-like glycosyltransferase
MWWTILAAVTLIIVVGAVLQIEIGNRRISALRDQAPAPRTPCPRVSIVVAARNEQQHVESAIQSFLQLDYGDLEIIAVNDRSTDRTGDILQALAAHHAALQVEHVLELPAGWLGKNHAQWRGAQRARGEYLLFTDADVVMDPLTLRRAIAYVTRQEADHVTISPHPVMPSLILQAFVVLFINLFALFLRPWKVADPHSSAFIGIGAFNLVRRDVYEAVGTHQTIAMRPDDDVKLGKIIKSNGYRQRVLFGNDMIRVPWYDSVRALILGMEKNAFSGVDYRIWLVLLSTAVLLATVVWPFVAVWVLSGPARYLYTAVVLLLLVRSWITARDLHQSRWSPLLLPLVVLLLIYIQWRAMLLTYIRGGIRWRDTHYPLADLKANRV